MDAKHEALDFFRKAVSFIYREVGAFVTANHPELASKAKLQTSFFPRDRKMLARKTYEKTIAEESTQRIIEPYVELTGLTLGDVHRIFSEGDWLLGRKHYSFGGPRWAEITEATMKLRQIIDSEDWNQVSEFMKYAKQLQHNNNGLVNKFKELE
jgi:hypothetical protein